MLIILPYLLPLLLPLFALLGVYEAVRGIFALRKGERGSLIANDFIAAVVLLGVAGLILCIGHGHFNWFWWCF